MDSAHSRLLTILIQHVENGWVCPSLPRLAQMIGVSDSTIGTYLKRLRQAGVITSRLIDVKPFGRARVVTITATGKSTATPQPSTRFNKPQEPPFTPIAGLTTAGRRLTGEEFAARAAELLARDAEERRRREMA